MSFVVAVDSGGTFTDCVVLDDRRLLARERTRQVAGIRDGRGGQ